MDVYELDYPENKLFAEINDITIEPYLTGKGQDHWQISRMIDRMASME